MRSTFSECLDSLESVTLEVEREVSNRVNNFKYSGGNTASSQDDARKILTRYFWNLFCPSMAIEEHWDDHQDVVWGRAESLLSKEYGNSLNALSIACSSVEEGLRGVLNELTKSYVKDQYHNRINAIVSRYYESSSPDELVADSIDFSREYKELLPTDKVENGGAYIRVHFLRILKELPFLLNQARIR